MLPAPLWAGDRLTSVDVAEIAGVLDSLIGGTARYDLAEQQAQKAMVDVVQEFGADSREALLLERPLLVAAILQGRAMESAKQSAHLLAKARRLLPANDPLLYRVIASRALALRVAGDLDAALALTSEALAVAEGQLAADDPAGDELWLTQASLAAALDDLSLADAAYARLADRLVGRDDAEARAMRAMAMIGWAGFVVRTGDLDRGIAIYQAAIAAMDEQFADIKHPRLMPARLAAVRQLAEALIQAGRRDEVEPLVAPLMDEVASVYGPDAPQWGDLAFPLSIVLGGTEPGAPRASEAIALLSRVIAVWEPVYGPDVEDLVRARLNLAQLLASAGQTDAAMGQIGKVHTNRVPGARTQLTYVLHEAELVGQITRDQAVDAILGQMQDSQSAGAGAAQRLLAERLAAGSDAGAGALRDLTDAKGRLDSLRSQMVALVGLPVEGRAPGAADLLRQAISDAQGQVEAATARIDHDFPALAAATGRLPLPLAEIRTLLAADQALVVIVPPEGVFDAGLVVAISRDALDWHTFQAEGTEVDQAVLALRTGIDLRLGLRGAAALSAEEGETGKTADFDFAAAYWLYTQTLGQVEAVTHGKAHLLLDLRGVMATLPPQLLLASPVTDPARADWLVRHHAISVLPAISALRPSAAAPAEGPLQLAAFADPEFGGLAAGTRLAPLPETADEVREVARALGAGPEALHLSAAASERAVKQADLSRVGLLYFATHGLMSGDDAGQGALDEPALALTPGGGEDGFLKASEIAELHLNARFVVLSACNTAAGTGPRGEALSGLVQSFLYAGARGLLVSHWPVESHSAVALMTGLFRHRAADPAIRAARAQQLAILDMIDHPADPRWSHPAYWAPFILVGNPD
ncbi:CHAT domain-containing protein [Fuscibacter oryzae]|uniref:CHAT domain-containing protein n=1 Tax=Fuscibacter oryzae TaxID=2803939 RepID=A0A8J7MRZ0_9RHOB|nr:CHAT domain-containing tetratricopeptide repeat protein [Fuscibacter oryzae]MBL4927820.1 CHAT domain-containing protein [Fuscibacter oryzae]